MNEKYDAEYTAKLEGVIKQMIAPLKNIPLKLVLESISGKKLFRLTKITNNIKKEKRKA